MLSSLVSMLPCSMVRCAEGEGKTALIDQRAVAAGKKTVASCTTLLPVVTKTNAADGPLFGFTTLLLNQNNSR